MFTKAVGLWPKGTFRFLQESPPEETDGLRDHLVLADAAMAFFDNKRSMPYPGLPFAHPQPRRECPQR